MDRSTWMAVVPVFGLAVAIAGRCVHAEEQEVHASPMAAQPAPRMEVTPPVPGPLAKGVAVIPFHVENLKLMPIYGEAAQAVVPRIGHLHITVDGQSWHWVQASDEPLVIQGLATGSHVVLLELADPTHKVIDAKSVSFEIAERPAAVAKP